MSRRAVPPGSPRGPTSPLGCRLAARPSMTDQPPMEPNALPPDVYPPLPGHRRDPREWGTRWRPQGPQDAASRAACRSPCEIATRVCNMTDPSAPLLWELHRYNCATCQPVWSSPVGGPLDLIGSPASPHRRHAHVTVNRLASPASRWSRRPRAVRPRIASQRSSHGGVASQIPQRVAALITHSPEPKPRS